MEDANRFKRADFVVIVVVVVVDVAADVAAGTIVVNDIHVARV